MHTLEGLTAMGVIMIAKMELIIATKMSLYSFFKLIFLFLLCGSLFAWDGYDYETGSYVEIEKDNLVREGEEIEFYDYESGDYRYGEVQSIDSYGSSVEVEVYDYETGEYRTFDMDR